MVRCRPYASSLRPARLGTCAPYDAATWSSIDLSTDDDVEQLHSAVRGADAVVHLTWGFQPSHREDQLAALGVGGTQRVIDAVTAAKVPHLVHMSSVGAYSPKQDDAPVDESWPTGGVPTSMYGRHKATAERLPDRLETDAPEVVVTRMRPGIVGQRNAGSALLRYDLRAVTAQDIAHVVGARLVHVPSAAVRAAVSVSWHARVQPLDPGWVDMGFAVPLLDTTRATSELGWSPTKDALTVLAETIEGMRDSASDRSPVLRPRSVVRSLGRFARRGPVSSRQRPCPAPASDPSQHTGPAS